jgi:cytochrome b6-f complex iron-sulfur subunit
MTLVDDLKAPVAQTELDRRKALGVLTGAAFAIAGGGTVITTIRYMRPNVLFEPPTKVTIGTIADIPMGTLLVLIEQKLYIAHTDKGIFAMSSVCTHLGCMTRYDAEKNAIACPCHGSKFDAAGNVTGGPAPRPLVRKEITLEGDLLVVDTRKNVSESFFLKA